MRALPGPGGGQALLPQASYTGRGGKRPGRIRNEDLDRFCRKFSFEAMCGMISLDDQPCIIEEHDDGDQF